MTSSSEREDLSSDAREIVMKAMRRSISESEDDLGWLPEEFAETIIELAWRHQFDIDRAAFRRHFRAYITQVSAVETP